MSEAAGFLARFLRADREGQVLTALADDPDGFAAALELMPAALGEAMAQAVDLAHGAPVVVRDECFASAACDRHGAIMQAGERFMEWFGSDYSIDVGTLAGIEGRRCATLLGDDADGRRIALAAGPADAAQSWPLEPAVRAALAAGTASHAIVAFRPGVTSWQDAARAYRFTQAEALLVASLCRHGDLQRAAAERGIAYETARKFVASAMRKSGARRHTDLIRQTLMLAAGDVPDSAHLAKLARDLFDLTERQANLALLIARGETREQAARLLGMSEHRAKADLRTVFLACGVASAGEMARIMAEINALQGLATACDITVTPRGHTGEPLRLVPRGWQSGKIAVADHGPRTAMPVLIFHTNTSGRHQSRTLIAALQSGGFRPIAMERAGFGLSDPVEGDPVQTAVRDVRAVVDRLDLPRVLILGRGATAACIACADDLGARVAGGVLLGPDTPAKLDRARGGVIGRAKGIFYDHPELAEAFARILSRRTGRVMIERLARAAVGGEKIDRAVLDDQAERADFVRGAQQSAASMHGFLNELLAHGRGAPMARLADARNWTIFYGAHDMVYSAADAPGLWAEALPGAAITIIPDGARFIHVTHTQLIVAALARIG